jgi:hypothetical protein
LLIVDGQGNKVLLLDNNGLEVAAMKTKELQIDGKTVAKVATSGDYNDLKNIPNHSAAGDDLGLVQSGGDVSISEGLITVKDDSHNHTSATITDFNDKLNILNAELGESITSESKELIIVDS